MHDETIQIRWHGRGGQGAITAARIFGQAAFDSSYSGVVMAPSFGTERRGAPVEVSLKISKTRINDLCPIENPDVVVVLDASILRDTDVTAGIKPGGIVVINTPGDRSVCRASNVRVATADVTHLAEKAGLKRGIVNTGIIGALARALPIVPLAVLLEAIKTEFGIKRADANVKAARLSHDHTTME